jgi:Zn-dependent M28 family amino/carboxypeptidase
MRNMLLMLVLLTGNTFSFCQNIDKIINAKEVERIERTLSSDEMQGRKAFTPGIDKAADFIASEFKKIGLLTENSSGSYLQNFSLVRPKFISASGVFDSNALEQKNIIAVTCLPELTINQSSGYEMAVIKPGDDLMKTASGFINAKKNLLVLVYNSFASNFSRLARFKMSIFKTDKNVVFVLADAVPSNYSIEVKHSITEQQMANVVGVIPGKSKKDEYVIFSGHYDHLGIGKATADGDSIFNGANDDAAGTTAVIMLAKYFAAVKNNERTIVFAAFTGEEIGGYGSQYFSKQYEADKVMAMFNIEMIGTESKWGKNSAYITGYDKTDMGKILEQNLKGTGFTFYPDPYPDQQLFYRSDNATLARLGAPAHTISTSKMDSEKFYHTQDDEIETLDMANMAEIIKAIAISSKTIVSDKDTPGRVDREKL